MPLAKLICFELMSNRANVDVIVFISKGFLLMLAGYLEALQIWCLHIKLLCV